LNIRIVIYISMSSTTLDTNNGSSKETPEVLDDRIKEVVQTSGNANITPFEFTELNNAVPLNYSYYDNDKYNRLRRCKLMLFTHSLGDDKNIIPEKYPDLVNTSDPTKSVYLIKEYIAKKIERSCLNRAIDKAHLFNIRCIWSDVNFVDLYNNICYKIVCNISEDSPICSQYIRDKILNADIDLNNIANRSSKELCPEKYDEIDQKIDQRANLKLKIKFSELYRCSKCKRNQCTTERRYNRSLDEGVNLTINCVFCGYSWCA
jgi:DNA-directed RNA polymerase subunit M/transcription elongation factor TFIIS